MGKSLEYTVQIQLKKITIRRSHQRKKYGRRRQLKNLKSKTKIITLRNYRVVRGRNTVQEDSPESGEENEDEEEEEEPSKRNRAAPQASKKNHTVSKDVRNVEQEDGDGTGSVKDNEGDEHVSQSQLESMEPETNYRKRRTRIS
ncbi:hypothetical protein BDD12DRAFT_266647 [Trichophaea hybrida]|nr:hypothetical protein BDD12DRAFT_266647 [Trichophaea hybrida]